MEAAAELLRCSPMATDVPQRDLRNRTADLLRRVEAGERLRITVHGHPIAELVPIEEGLPPRTFAPLKEFFEGIAGVLGPEEAREWADEVRELRESSRLAADPFEEYEKKRAEEREMGAAGDE
jgi:prevent-host-death family protein